MFPPNYQSNSIFMSDAHTSSGRCIAITIGRYIHFSLHVRLMSRLPFVRLRVYENYQHNLHGVQMLRYSRHPLRSSRPAHSFVLHRVPCRPYTVCKTCHCCSSKRHRLPCNKCCYLPVEYVKSLRFNSAQNSKICRRHSGPHIVTTSLP
jgi:hypothetical protein